LILIASVIGNAVLYFLVEDTARALTERRGEVASLQMMLGASDDNFDDLYDTCIYVLQDNERQRQNYDKLSTTFDELIGVCETVSQKYGDLLSDYKTCLSQLDRT